MTSFRPQFLFALLISLLPWLYWFAHGGGFGWQGALTLIAVIHLVAPAVDYIIGDVKNREPIQAATQTTHWANRAIPLLCVPAWFGALGFATWQGQTSSGADWILTGIAIGAVGGSGAINIAHELIHRQTRVEREAGGLLLSSVLYSAFRTEHVLGHHLNVATPRDTATARRGENVYGFFVKSALGTLTNAWRIERSRLSRRSQSVFSLHNRYLQGLISTFVIAVILSASFGMQAIGMMALVSVVAIFELEVINFIEHYGLMRRQQSNGRYEPFGPQHAWNADTAVMNAMLINLQRHADHHMHAGKDYIQLRSMPDSPQLPAGYGAMFLLAFVPPLWRAVMHPRLDALSS